ncbi:hypothetical protein JOB18_026360 [Solea senegalensis]|uniref:Uncharacterized protein n=1 Tax=Solea senegalensis TaxID=28829 RepID=A0AAV6QUN4_SOLSE|nr:hypothetical protein JOB18_026360 [Solea senegalensis]
MATRFYGPSAASPSLTVEPLSSFYDILDISAYNKFVIWRELNPEWNRAPDEMSLSQGSGRGTGPTSNPEKTCSKDLCIHYEENSGDRHLATGESHFAACGSPLPEQWPHRSLSTTPTPWTRTSPAPPESL